MALLFSNTADPEVSCFLLDLTQKNLIRALLSQMYGGPLVHNPTKYPQYNRNKSQHIEINTTQWKKVTTQQN